MLICRIDSHDLALSLTINLRFSDEAVVIPFHIPFRLYMDVFSERVNLGTNTNGQLLSPK